MARPGPEPDNPTAAFLGGLALGVVKGKILANAGRQRTSHQGSSQRRGIPPAKVALAAGAAGVGLGLIKAGALSGAFNGK